MNLQKNLLRARSGFLAESRDAAAWMAAIVENSEDAILSKTLDGIIMTWNAGACRMFGYSAAEAVGMPISLVIPDERLHEENAILSQLRAGERVAHFETYRRRKDGSQIKVSVAVSPVRNHAGQILGASKVARYLGDKVALDLAEKQKAEFLLHELRDELHRVSRLSTLGDMATALAHELNQPLTAIANLLAGSTTLLKRGGVPLERITGALDFAARETERAGEIILRLRDFVSRGEADLRFESVVKLIDAASSIALMGAPEDSASMTIEISPEVDLVLVDRVQIQQVIFNLIRNALESMAESERRELVVQATPTDGEMVLITIGDTGPGISTDVAERLFEPFVTTKRTGMGVGLSICRTIVEAHGGRIWASPRSGGGALFSFTIAQVRKEEGDHAG